MLEAHNKGKMVITTERSENIIMITFTDDGSGITQENPKHMFNPSLPLKKV